MKSVYRQVSRDIPFFSFNVFWTNKEMVFSNNEKPAGW